LKILTGDAIFAQRPLLEVLKNRQVDDVFQVKDNQPEVLEAIKETFKARKASLTAVYARARDKPKKSLKRLGLIN